MSQVPLVLSTQRHQGFDNFHEGENGSLMQAIKPPLKNNFVYIHGGLYAGKTHLLNALASSFKAAGKSVVWIDPQMLTERSVVDVLPSAQLYLIDDVDKIAGDASAEEGLFNVYNSVYSGESHLIVCSRKPPSAACWQLPDLVSRLNAGLTILLKPLKGEAAFQLFLEMAEQMGLELKEKQVNYIKTHANTSFSSLYQLLKLVNRETLAVKKKITTALLKSLIQHPLSDHI